MDSVYQRMKKQRSLIIVFFIILAITFLILYFGYFRKEKISPSPLPAEVPKEISPQMKIEINFSVFESPIFKLLRPFEKIEPPKPEEIGRENPFLPIQ
jgi:hypothetical protein